MASLHTYAATGGPNGLELHLYAPGTFTAAGRTVRVETAYPWSETVSLTVTDPADGPWTLALRVPAWCTNARLSVNGSLVRAGDQQGYLRLTRTWRPGDRVELVLAMPPRLIAAHYRVDAVRGTAALARGPLVYCVEHADLPESLARGAFEDIELDPRAPIETVEGSGFVPVRVQAALRLHPHRDDALYRPLGATATPDRPSTAVPTVPYFLWANRASGPMRVWIPLATARPHDEPASTESDRNRNS
jgi:hypothetical protein